MRLPLPPDAKSAALARRAVLAACAEVEIDVDALLLCASELVTNAVLHGSPPLELRVAVADRHVRVEVRDGNEQPPRRRDPLSNDTLSGRGLGIVEVLTSRWGIDRDGTGKVTWFEIDCPEQ